MDVRTLSSAHKTYGVRNESACEGEGVWAVTVTVGIKRPIRAGRLEFSGVFGGVLGGSQGEKLWLTAGLGR